MSRPTGPAEWFPGGTRPVRHPVSGEPHRFHEGESCFAGCPAWDSKAAPTAPLDVVAELRAVQMLALQGIAAIDDEHEGALLQAVAELVNRIGAVSDAVLSW